VKVHLLGRDYLLRSSGDPEMLQEAALLVEEKFACVPTTTSVDTRDRQMLAMLNLAGEYLQEKRRRIALEAEQKELLEQNALTDRQKSKRENALISRIEDALLY
jgi:hypothetical protein